MAAENAPEIQNFQHPISEKPALKIVPNQVNASKSGEARLPHGASVHVRRLKSAGKETEAEIFQRQAQEAKKRQEELREVDETRIKDLTEMLEMNLSGSERADYSIEKMFLELKLDRRGWDDHRKTLANYMDSLPEDVARYLDGKIPDGKGGDTSRLLQIRDRIIPKEQMNRLMSRK